MIKINGVQIKTPIEMDVEHFNITKSDRTASGLMTMEFIAKKTKLTIKYSVLRGTDLQLIRSLIDTTVMFFDVTYYDDYGTQKTITCYWGTLQYSKYRQSAQHMNGGWYWKDVQIDMIER